MKNLLYIILFAASFSLYGQGLPSIDFHGFVRTDLVYDSEESVRLRENAIMLYPAKSGGLADAATFNGDLTMFVLHTRLRGNISGPDAFGAKTTGAIEGEFFGSDDNDANGFRLRHAFINFDWGNTQALAGQYWNPMFIVDVLPNFNFSSPFLPYGRRPQLKITHSLGNIKISGTASFQSDFKSYGPAAEDKTKVTRSTAYAKNAATPMLNINMIYKNDNYLVGAGADFKKLIPARGLDSASTNNQINSMSANIYGKAKLGPVTAKFQGLLTQNLSDLVMIGGYGLKSDGSNEYTNLNYISGWAEISTGDEYKASLYAGYSQCIGADDDINPAMIYGLGTDINKALRVAPSLIWTSGKTRLVAELEYTAAWYGSEFDSKHLAESSDKYENIRFNIALFYHF